MSLKKYNYTVVIKSATCDELSMFMVRELHALPVAVGDFECPSSHHSCEIFSKSQIIDSPQSRSNVPKHIEIVDSWNVRKS